MEGNNSMTICQPMMVKIVQKYFNETMFREGEAPTVISVKAAIYPSSIEGEFTVGLGTVLTME